MEPEVLRGRKTHEKNKSSRRHDENPKSWFLKMLVVTAALSLIELSTVNVEEAKSSEIDHKKEQIIVVCCRCIGCRFCFDHCIEICFVCWEIYVGALAVVPLWWLFEANTLPDKPFPFQSLPYCLTFIN